MHTLITLNLRIYWKFTTSTENLAEKRGQGKKHSFTPSPTFKSGALAPTPSSHFKSGGHLPTLHTHRVPKSPVQLYNVSYWNIYCSKWIFSWQKSRILFKKGLTLWLFCTIQWHTVHVDSSTFYLQEIIGHWPLTNPHTSKVGDTCPQGSNPPPPFPPVQL
jgi:hypothetical protein